MNNRLVCVLSLALVAIVGLVANAQCVDCSNMSSVMVGQPVVTSLAYSPPIVTSVTCSDPLNVEYLSSSQCFSGANQAADFNIGCAVQGATAFTACRAIGGGILPCALEGFSTYLNCNGGLRLRRRQVRAESRRARRAARSRRFLSRGNNTCG